MNTSQIITTFIQARITEHIFDWKQHIYRDSCTSQCSICPARCDILSALDGGFANNYKTLIYPHIKDLPLDLDKLRIQYPELLI